MSDARILDERIDGLSHTFRVSLCPDQVCAAVDARLQEMGRTIPMPGFRPGRAPLKILRKRYGRRVRTTVVDRMAIDLACRLIAENKIEPIGRPTIHLDAESNPPSESLTFSLVLKALPKVELARCTGIRLRHLRVPQDDSALADEASALLRRHLFDALMSRHDFAIPNDMAENEYGRIARGFEAEVGELVDAELESDLRRIAERRVRLAILLTAIGRENDIRVPRTEVEALIEREAERDPAHEAEIIDYYLDHPTALAELQSPLFEERVVDFLLAQSEIEEVEVSADELRRALGEV